MSLMFALFQVMVTMIVLVFATPMNKAPVSVSKTTHSFADMTATIDPVGDNITGGEMNRIHAGRMVSHEEFGRTYSFMVAVIQQNGNRCSGFLVNLYYVMTAAHCAVSSHERDVNGTLLTIAEGVSTNDIAVIPNEFNEDYYHLVDVIYHPRFNPIDGSYDVALLELGRPVRRQYEYVDIQNEGRFPFRSQFLEFVDANFRAEDINRDMTIIGFGDQYQEGNPHNIPQPLRFEDHRPFTIRVATDMIRTTKEFCKQSWRRTIRGDGRRHRIGDDKICVRGAGVEDHHPLQSYTMRYYHTICERDAGSPLLFQNKLVGIASFGPEPCGSTIPAVFTLLNAVRDFVLEEMAYRTVDEFGTKVAL